jgi:lysozyme
MTKTDRVAVVVAILGVFAALWWMTTKNGTSDVDSPDGGGYGLDSLWGNTFGAVGAIVSSQTVSDVGINLIKQYEGCKLTSYFDVDGYSIGYGHHSPLISADQTCTQEQADAWLANDANAAACSVLKFCRVDLSQNQLDALTDWMYNFGATKVQNATLWSVLNAGNYDGVPDQLMRWVNVNGSPDSGLQARRQAECDIWNGGGN